MAYVMVIVIVMAIVAVAALAGVRSEQRLQGRGTEGGLDRPQDQPKVTSTMARPPAHPDTPRFGSGSGRVEARR